MSETPQLSPRASRRELRKAIIRLRLEVQRQQLHQETRLLLQPLHQAQTLGRQVGGQLHGAGAATWAAGGAAALAMLFGRKRSWLRLLRLGLTLAPLFMKRKASKPAATSTPSETSAPPPL
ncbi:MAG: hypothetical protein GAK45_01208 [Pseudomonas citronellolis]|nr:MAG: hypothetical protein GAK45_01208 [Pseudomonas citronellolis]